MAESRVDDDPIDLTKVILYLVLAVVIGAVLVVYTGVLAWAADQSLRMEGEPDIPKALNGVTTAVASALATNLGAFLGVTAAGLGTLSVATVRQAFKFPTPQALASLYYVVLLVGALVVWGLDGFSDTTAEIIRTHAATVFGVGVGALAVVLNVKLKR